MQLHPDIVELKTINDELVNTNQNLLQSNKNLENRLTQYQEAYEQMRANLQNLLRDRYGQRSERDIDPNNPQLDLLADELAQNKQDASIADEPGTTVGEHQRKKKKKNTDQYPREIVIIAVPDDEKICACGCQKNVIRYETKELHDYQPALKRIIEQRREVVACPKGCEKSIQVAPAPLTVLPKVSATEHLLAHVVTTKLQHRQPLYHLEKYVTSVGFSRQTLSRWIIDLHPPVQPILNLLKDEVIDYDVASIDATGLQVLKEPGRPAHRNSYAYCIRGGPPEKSVILFEYNALAHKQFVDEWFEGFTGYVHMDADNFFDLLTDDEQVEAIFCHAHGRRKFEKVKKSAKKQGLAHEALRYYKKLYKIERYAKENNMTAAERYELRQRESAPVLAEFKDWLEAHVTNLLPKSPLGRAFNYLLKRWVGFTAFLKDGRLEIDNNLTEQVIKQFVIIRKNFLFADTVKGAAAVCAHFSLIQTALLHQLDPYEYYAAILKRIPHCQKVADYEALLPWNIKL